jgi:large subunit ribosomal protein L4
MVNRMPVVDVVSIKGEKVTQIELSDEIFKIDIKNRILHETVVAQLAAKRAGNASVKRRSDIVGSNRKLYRQKGTGRARKGNIKSPILRGGGVVFGPESKSYAVKVNKKVKRLALKMALSSKLKQEELTIIDRFELERIKTKDFVGILKDLDIKSALIVTDTKNKNLEKSSRNVPGTKIIQAEGLNVYDVLKYNQLLLTEPSIKGIEGRLAS